MYQRIVIVVAALLLSMTISGILPLTSVRLAAEEDEISDKDDMASKARKREQCIVRCLKKGSSPICVRGG